MPRRQWFAIAIFLFVAVFLALGDRYFAPTKTAVIRDEPPISFLDVLLPGLGGRLGKYCGEPSPDTWLKKYYCETKATDRYLALATVVLAVSTIGLWIVSVCAGRRQSRETQILQRAYLSVEPVGIEPWVPFGSNISSGEVVVCHCGIHNKGNLPARDVRWHIDMRFCSKDDLKNEDFPIGNYVGEGIVIPPQVTIRQGGPHKPILDKRMMRGTQHGKMRGGGQHIVQ